MIHNFLATHLQKNETLNEITILVDIFSRDVGLINKVRK